MLLSGADSALLAVAQSSKVIKCNSICFMLLAVLLGCVVAPCCAISLPYPALALPFMCCFPALPCPAHVLQSPHVLRSSHPCPALPCPALPYPALPCPALCDGLLTFGATVTGVCTALRPVKGGEQKKMCVTPLQHSLPCFSCCQDLVASGKLLLLYTKWYVAMHDRAA